MPFRLSQADLTDGDRAALLAAMLDSTLDAVVVIDTDGVVLEWSRTATEIFGFSREAAVGRLLDNLIIPPDLVEAHRTGMARFRATGKGTVLGRRIEIEAVSQAGERFPIELAITEVPSRTQIFFIARLRNITDRVRYGLAPR